MSFLLAILLCQNPNTSNIVIVASDGTMEVWPQLVAGADNKPAIQAAIDRCEAQPGRETLRLPPGTWTVGTSVELVGDVDYMAEMVELKPLDATFQRAIIVAGASTHPDGGGTRARADRVSIVGLTINQTAATSPASNGLFAIECNDWRLTRCKVKNAKHEGMVSGGFSVGWVVDQCEAEDCGSGDSFRQASGAGLNLNGMRHVVKDCVTRRCPQGYEHGGNWSTFIRCQALDGTPGLQGPSIGFNLGSAVAGLYRTRVVDCKSTGHLLAMSIANGIGRCGGVMVDSFVGEGGGISFSGGKENNIVPNEWEGPDLEASYLIKCKLKFTAATNTGFIYNPGPSTASAVYGRAPFYIIDPEVEFVNVPVAQQQQAPFAVAGNVDTCEYIRPVVRGLDSWGLRGDFYTFSSGTNLSPNPSGKLKAIDGKAFKADGQGRFFHELRETPR